MKLNARSQLALACLLMAMSPVLSGTSRAAEPAPADRVAVVFEKVDTDKDKVITLAEWQAAGRKQRGFETLDENADGKITPDEMRAVLAKFGR